MNVSFSTEMEVWIKEQVASGDYGSEAELVRAAVWELRNKKEGRPPSINNDLLKRVLEIVQEPEINTLEDLRREIEQGRRGPMHVWNKKAMETLLDEADTLRQIGKALNREGTTE